ncbi:hypothetical protein PCE1_002408 [Barthelona sp. PCE]
MAAVNSLIAQEKYSEALISLLPEVVPHSLEECTDLTISILSILKQGRSRISPIVEDIEMGKLHILVGFIYFGFELIATNKCPVSASVLYKWHDEIVKVGGEGIITRFAFS